MVFPERHNAAFIVIRKADTTGGITALSDLVTQAVKNMIQMRIEWPFSLWRSQQDLDLTSRVEQ